MIRRTKEKVLEQWNETTWGVAVAEMKLRLADGLVEQACTVLRRHAYREMPELATLDCSPSEVFPVRLAKSLEDEGYTNLRSVHLERDANLLSIPNFGPSSLKTVRETLNAVVSGACYATNVALDEEGF